jgi:hypothetical protein
LLWAIPGLYGTPGAVGILAGTVSLAFAYTIRPNWLPGILWIYGITAAGNWKKFAKTILLAAGAALSVGLLPLLHNVIYSGQWVLSTMTGGNPVNLILPPSTWLAFLRGDAPAAEAVVGQIGKLVLLTDVPRSMLPGLASMALFLFGWLVVVVDAIARRMASAIAWLALPLVFLSPHLFYDAITYYPRHIVAGYLCMALTAVLILIRGKPESHFADKAAAVESPHA